MIFGSMFYGDDQTEVMNIQYEEYGNIIGMFFRRAAEKYRNAEKLLQVTTPLSSRIPDSFDHRVIQGSHDLIAAYFRYQEYSHGPLFKEDVDKAECLERWYKWAHQEIDILLDSPEFARAFILAVVEQNTEIGYANEDIMIQFLKLRFAWMLTTTMQK